MEDSLAKGLSSYHKGTTVRVGTNARHGRATRVCVALRGRTRVHNAGEIMSEIVAKRLVRHLERAGFVVMRKPPLAGHSALARGFGER